MDARFAVDFGLLSPTFPAPARDDAHHRQLVADHVGLVRKIAWHVHGRVSSAIDIEDLMQIGMVALIGAARAFVDRGEAVFATYAAVRVRGAMIDDLRKHATLCRSALKRRREIAEARAVVEGAVGRPATEAELATRMGLSVDAFRQAEAGTHAARQESIEEVYSDHSIWFADETPAADEALDRERLRERLGCAITGLPIRERQVLQLYFVDELNLEEIGAVLGVGGARVCQIKRAALDKVRKRLAAYADA